MLFGKRKIADAAARPGVKVRRWSRMSVGSRISLIFLALLAACAVLAPVISPRNPLEITTKLLSPSAEHWFGTDSNGKSLFDGVWFGARNSILTLWSLACRPCFLR